MRQRDKLNKYNNIINTMVKISNIFPKIFYKHILKIFRNLDNKVGIFIRYICLKNLCKECGDNVAVFSGVYLLNIEKLSLGNNVSIHPMCYIDAYGGIKIGDNVSIAHSTTIMSSEHIHKDININIKDQGCKKKFTNIESNVWIGSGSRILAGSNIEKGSIVAAGAVVNKVVGEFTIVGGIPAKFIKERM